MILTIENLIILNQTLIRILKNNNPIQLNNLSGDISQDH